MEIRVRKYKTLYMALCGPAEVLIFFNYLHLGWLDSLWLAQKQRMMSSVVLQEQENKPHLIFIGSEDQY